MSTKTNTVCKEHWRASFVLMWPADYGNTYLSILTSSCPPGKERKQEMSHCDWTETQPRENVLPTVWTTVNLKGNVCQTQHLGKPNIKKYFRLCIDFSEILHIWCIFVTLKYSLDELIHKKKGRQSKPTWDYVKVWLPTLLYHQLTASCPFFLDKFQQEIKKWHQENKVLTWSRLKELKSCTAHSYF